MSDTPTNATDPARDQPGAPAWVDWFDSEYGVPALPPPAAPAQHNGDQPGEAVGEPGDDDWVDELWSTDDDTPVSMAVPARSAPSFAVRAGRRIVRRPYRWITSPWPPERIVQTAFTFASLAATTLVMLRVVHFNPLEWAGLGPADLIFDDTTPDGGDMGAHVWAPAYLRDVLLPNWQLSGWSMDWYAGLPVYRFYMVVPALAIVALDTVFPYGVAFKVVAMSGMVSLPFCCWVFGRLARFRYPLPELFAFAGLCFLLNESYSIWGGNVKSTMAGEFSFSIAVSVMMLGLGFLARALDDGKYAVWAAALLAVACLCHGIVLIYTAVAALLLVACRCGADLWPVLVRATTRESPRTRQNLAYGVLMTPAAVVLTLVAAQWSRAFYALTALVLVGAIVAIVALCVQLGRADEASRRFRRRFVTVGVVAGLTLALSAFWVGPFLFNHEYMTDMKYGYRPDSRIYSGDSYWDLFFDQKLALDILVNGLAVLGFLFAIARRHVYGIALGLAALAGVGLTYLAHDSLPIIGLLWNPRVLPFVYLMRFLVMMMGALELFELAINAFRNRPTRADIGVGVRSGALAATGLAVLIVFGWVYQVLPGAGFVTKHGERVYAWGPFAAPGGQNTDADGDSWTAYNFNGYERRNPYPEYYNLIQTMDRIGDSNGCGRALWERDQRKDVGNTRYGSSMALMLLPFWTDGCIDSSEGLFFEASGTTPYHFITATAMSDDANPPVRQLRSTQNDATIGVPYLQTLGIEYLMVTRPEAIAEADAQPDLTPVAESGPWHIYQVADADVVVPLDVQPVVVNHRDGDQRECFLELGTSWFQQRDEWAALPATDGPASWQHIDVAIDPDRQEPEGQGTDGCGDPQSSLGRKVNIVEPVQAIEPVAVEPALVSNVVIGDQSVSFDVDRPGVPVLVKVSYFPNWEVSGADGPYRVAPNFMVVVPTGTHVELTYGRSTVDLAFDGMTLLGVVAAFGWRFRGPLRRRLHRL